MATEKIYNSNESGESLGKVTVGVLMVKKHTDGSWSVLSARRKNTPEIGRYGLPGGHVEDGETLIGAAIRELWEETGLISTAKDFTIATHGTHRFTVSNKIYRHYGFIVLWDEKMGQPTLKEPEASTEWEWIPEKTLTEQWLNVYGNTATPSLSSLVGVLKTIHFNKFDPSEIARLVQAREHNISVPR